MGAMSQGMQAFHQGYTATQGKRIDHHVLRSGHSQHVTASSGPERDAQGRDRGTGRSYAAIGWMAGDPARR
jgi:hypothetical protein